MFNRENIQLSADRAGAGPTLSSTAYVLGARLNMRILPSIPASIVTGAVILPLFAEGMNLIDRVLHPGVPLFILELAWGFVGFFIPAVVSTVDLRRVRARQREIDGDFFTPLTSRQDFNEIYLPGLIRMGVMMFFGVFSLYLLDNLGVQL